MRSWRSACLALAVGVVPACGTEYVPPDDEPLPDAGVEPVDRSCEESYLTYGNFGAPFAFDWCRGCHGSAIPEGMRQGATMGVDFDDLAALRQWSERIRIRATGEAPTMPPAGGPTAEERALLAEWLRCGAKE